MRSVGVLNTSPFRGSEFYLSYWKGIKSKVNLNAGDIWRLNNTEGYAIIGFSELRYFSSYTIPCSRRAAKSSSVRPANSL